jgi:hypothetical protein
MGCVSHNHTAQTTTAPLIRQFHDIEVLTRSVNTASWHMRWRVGAYARCLHHDCSARSHWRVAALIQLMQSAHALLLLLLYDPSVATVWPLLKQLQEHFLHFLHFPRSEVAAVCAQVHTKAHALKSKLAGTTPVHVAVRMGTEGL